MQMEVESRYKDVDVSGLQDLDEVEKTEVLKKRTQWNTLENAYFSKTQVNMLKDIESSTLSATDLIREKGRKYAILFLTVLSRVQRNEDIRYTLTLLEDLLINEPTFVQYFFNLEKEPTQEPLPSFPFGPFFQLVQRKNDDAYIVSKASAIISFLLVKIPSVQPDTVEAVLQWYVKQLNVRSLPEDIQHRMTSKVLYNLRTLLKVQKYRLDFIKEAGLEAVFELSRYDGKKKVHGRNVEIVYSALYVIWLLGFNSQAKKMMVEPQLFGNLCTLLKVCQEKDKIVRMSIAIMRNLVDIQQNNETMISCGLDKIILNLRERPSIMADKDVTDDIEVLEESLNKVKERLSSFDAYYHEVQAKALDWSSPCHKSEKFWIENCCKIQDSNILSILKDILEGQEENDVTLCIACWDIGEFVRFHPQGKFLVNQADLKSPIVKLLTHVTADVRNQALLTLQKVMITNWEFIAT